MGNADGKRLEFGLARNGVIFPLIENRYNIRKTVSKKKWLGEELAAVSDYWVYIQITRKGPSSTTGYHSVASTDTHCGGAELALRSKSPLLLGGRSSIILRCFLMISRPTN